MSKRVLVVPAIMMVVVLLAAPVAVACHHHDDHLEHPDCQVCQLADGLAALERPTPILLQIGDCRPHHGPSPTTDAPILAAIDRPRPRSPPRLESTSV